MNILHGFTGSVASTLHKKFKEQYVEKYGSYNCSFIYTKGAQKITNQENVTDFNCYEDRHEWMHYQVNHKVLHIDLVKWADALVIAPCSANTLAKIANGICDNLLTCVARAWDFQKQFIIAPSMNTKMWDHPITKEHLDKVKSWGIDIVDPIEKTLFCGDVGVGAMANVETIIKTLR